MKTAKLAGRHRCWAALVAAAALLGCKDRTSTANPSVLRVAIPTSLTSIDPIQIGDALTLQVIVNTYETLVGVDPDGNFVPGLAASWEALDNGTRWVFHLRPSRFSPDGGGREVEAEDVLATLKRAARHPRSIVRWVIRDYIAGGADYADGRRDSITGLRARDARTVEILLNAPIDIAARLALPQLSVLPRELANDSTINLDSLGRSVGSGPYMISSIGPERVVLVRNPNSAIKPQFSRVELAVFRDASAALAQFRAGALDIVPVPLTHWAQVMREAGKPELLVLDRTVHFEYLIVNTRDPALSDPDLRAALLYSIDRERLCSEILQGGCVPTDFTSAPAKLAGPNLFDPAAAKRHWNRARIRPSTVDLLTTPEFEQQLVAGFLQETWKNHLGLDVRVRNLEFGALMGSLFSAQPFQLARFWVQPLVDLPEIWFMSFRPGDPPPRGRNFSAYANPDLKPLFQRTLSPLDSTQRREVMEAMEAVLRRDPPILPLFQRKYAYLVNPVVRLPLGYALRYHFWDARSESQRTQAPDR